MSGHSPLLCNPAQKAELEAANGVEQFDFLAHLVNEWKIVDLRETHLLELQSIAVKGIYPCGGQYRDALSRVTITGSTHQPPEAALVPALVRDALDWINRSREEGRPAFDRAAFALWRFNWIHPFRGGNGRTSRALTYLILCLDMGMMLPGVPTLPALIYDTRDEYVAALKAVDASVVDKPDADPTLTVMSGYLRRLVTKQLASAVAKLASPVK